MLLPAAWRSPPARSSQQFAKPKATDICGTLQHLALKPSRDRLLAGRMEVGEVEKGQEAVMSGPDA